MADRFSYSAAPHRKVKALQFGVLDAEFLVRLTLLHAVMLLSERVLQAAVIVICCWARCVERCCDR